MFDVPAVVIFCCLWLHWRRSALTLDLQAALKELDADAAPKLERLVRDAMARARPATKPAVACAVDKNGWHLGFFEETAGCFANEPFDFTTDLPLGPIVTW